LLVLAQNVVVQSGFLNPPAAADVNGRNLFRVVRDSKQSGEESAILGRLF
jgi:hypothetical protein